MSWEVFGDAVADSLSDMTDRVRVVVAWNIDAALRRADIIKPCFSQCCERCETSAHDGLIAVSDLGSEA